MLAHLRDSAIMSYLGDECAVDKKHHPCKCELQDNGRVIVWWTEDGKGMLAVVDPEAARHLHCFFESAVRYWALSEICSSSTRADSFDQIGSNRNMVWIPPHGECLHGINMPWTVAAEVARIQRIGYATLRDPGEGSWHHVTYPGTYEEQMELEKQGKFPRPDGLGIDDQEG